MYTPNHRKDCCSIPRFGLETPEKWRTLMNKACCYHDDMYDGKIYAKNRREADDRFYAAMIEVARENEHKYGYLGFLAAKDMYIAVRNFGWWAWSKNTMKRWRNKNARR